MISTLRPSLTRTSPSTTTPPKPQPIATRIILSREDFERRKEDFERRKQDQIKQDQMKLDQLNEVESKLDQLEEEEEEILQKKVVADEVFMIHLIKSLMTEAELE